MGETGRALVAPLLGVFVSILLLVAPVSGQTYKVGVHYWEDNDFGPSFATVRIFAFGSLVMNMAVVEINNCELWEVADIPWPADVVRPTRTCTGTKTRCSVDAECPGSTCDGFLITPDYSHPGIFSECGVQEQ